MVRKYRTQPLVGRSVSWGGRGICALRDKGAIRHPNPLETCIIFVSKAEFLD